MGEEEGTDAVGSSLCWYIDPIDATSNFDGDEAYYNVQTGVGWFSNGRGSIHARVTPRSRMLLTENPFYVRAARVERRSESLYFVERAHMTTFTSRSRGPAVAHVASYAPGPYKKQAFCALLRSPHWVQD